MQLAPEGYSALALAKVVGSQVDEDNIAFDWAKCHETALNTRLRANPALRGKIRTLRSEYQLFREAEANVGELLAGGGTMYGHAIPRSYPQIELVLNDYAFLSEQPGSNVQNGNAKIRIAITADQMRYRLTSLRALKPYSAGTLTGAEMDDYNVTVAKYELAYRALVETLGSDFTPRNNVVMQSLYASELLDPFIKRY